ncbi:MAG: DUF3352 domain-containing protein [Phycisphaerales bacterium]
MKNVRQTNHKLSLALMVALCWVLVLLCSPVSICAGALPKTAKLIPPETILLVDIDNFSRLRAQFERTSVYKLYKDPAMSAFVDDFKAKWRDKVQKSDNELVRIIADADVLPQGRAAVALALDEQTIDANEPPVLFISEWGENTGKVKETVDKIVKRAVEEGAHRKAEEYRGVSITVITGKSSAALSYCFVDDCLIGSMNPEALKFVIAHVKGAGSPTLADDDDYAATMNAVGPAAEGQIGFYANIKQALKSMVAEDPSGKAKTWISNLGFDNVTSFGFSVDLAGGPGGSSAGKAFLKIDGAKRGICKMLEVESAALRMPRFVPASACSVSFVNLNIKKAYNELANILTNFSPQFAMLLYMPLSPPGPQGEPPLQLKTDVIDHLGSQIIIAQSIDKPAPGVTTTEPAQSLVAVAIDNRGALEKSLSLIHSNMIAPNNPDARRELLGHTIYSVDPSGISPLFGPKPKPPMQAPLGTGAPGIPKMAFTVTDTHLIFASEPAVERAIRTLSSSEAVPLASAKWFTRAKSNIPSAVGLAGLQDTAASAEHYWTAVRESARTRQSTDSPSQVGVGAGAGSALPQLLFSQGGADLFDFSLLPEFDAVRKYFGLSASYGISRQDGFFFEFKYLNPDTSE